MIPTPKRAKDRCTDHRVVHREVLAAVKRAKNKLTPRELEKKVAGKLFMDKKECRGAIRDLVLDRELVYTYHFGCSFLERSLNKPTRISNRVVLKPPGMSYRSDSGCVVVTVQQGVSFGSGEHPTTRLAIQGIDAALSGNKFRTIDDRRALDIGTGTGVLAITAVLLGIKDAVGVDIDACARAEAKKNIQLNRLEHRIKIIDRNIEDIKENFFLITANLRYPTLKRLSGPVGQRVEKTGMIVVSGVKADEVSDLLNDFRKMNFKCLWKAFESDWAGMVFSR